MRNQFYKGDGMKILKYYLLSVYLAINHWVGRLLRRKGRLSNAKKILINRSDRIGDAVITIPLIMRLKELNYDVHVIASDSNRFIFERAGIQIDGIFNIIERNPIQKFFIFILKMGSTLIRRLMKPAHSQNKYDVFLDFTYRFLDPIQDLGQYCRKSIGYSFGLHSLAYDFRIPYPDSFPITRAMESMVTVFEPGFAYGVKPVDFECFIESNDAVKRIMPKNDFVLFHIGSKPPRRMNDSKIIELLNSSPETIVVVDDPSQPNINRIKEFIDNGCIMFVEEDLSLSELLAISSDPKCMLYIGHDGGHSHLLDSLSNCLILFTSAADHRVWRPFTGEEWTKETIGDGTVEKSILNGKLKFIAYKDSVIGPTFDIILEDGSREMDLSRMFKYVLKTIATEKKDRNTL